MLTTPDKRYDNFFSSILSGQKGLPNKIKIISWNYDFQIEKSYLEFDLDSDIHKARECLGLKSPKEWALQKDYANKFNIIKLNGSAIINTDHHQEYLFENLIDATITPIEQIIKKYLSIAESREKYECELKFAWETAHYEKLFKACSPDLSSIEVLVVIGYSFPFFNRDVDKRLFKCMSRLRKIYIQDLNPENIRETMLEFVDLNQAIKGQVEVLLRRNKEQFVFPRELEVTELTLKDL